MNRLPCHPLAAQIIAVQRTTNVVRLWSDRLAIVDPVGRYLF
jgi:hypothetical protein